MQTEFKIKHSRVLKNGIMIYSNSNEDYAAISTIDKDGNIKTEWSLTEKYRKGHKKYYRRIELKEFLLVLPPIIVITIFPCLMFYNCAFLDYSYSLRHFVRAYLTIDLFTIILAFLPISKSKPKFTSALHMLINAYSELGKAPSLEAIRNYSSLINSDGKNSLLIDFISHLLLLFCTHIHNPFDAIMASLIVLVIVKPSLEALSYCYGFLNFIQKFTTTTPTDTELEVALSAMRVWIENEGYK